MGLVAALSVGSCQDILVDPAPAAPAALSLSVASIPLVEAGAQGPAAAFNAADRVQIRLLRGTNVVAELDQEFTPAGEETRIELEVELEGTSETLQLELTLSWQGQPLFTAGRSVLLELGRTTAAEVSLDPVAAGVEVQGEGVTLDALGAEAQLDGAVLFATGDVIPGLALTWTSGAPDRVQVSGDGRVTALAPGEAEVTGSYQEFSRSVTVQVEQVTASVAVDPGQAELDALGATLPFSATALDANGHPVPVDPGGFEWSSSAAGVATVSDQGVATAQGEGTTTIAATFEGTQGTGTLTVRQKVTSIEVEPESAGLEVDQTIRLEAHLFDGNGHSVPPEGRTLVWSSSNSSVATVDAQGIVTGVSGGEATITAAKEEAMGSADVTVEAPLASVTVDPETVELTALNQTVTFTATALNADGDPVSQEPGDFQWSSSAEGVATVSGEGVATAQGEGTTRITATFEGVEGFAVLTVRQGVASVIVEPASAQVEVEGTIQLQAHLFDENGIPIPEDERTITWISSDSGVATVDAQGLVEGISEGQATITATAEEVSGQAEVSVLGEPQVFEGNLQITNSEDLAEFEANGWEVVDGDLIIGEAVEGNFLLAGQVSPLVDLSGLETLRRVTGNLEIRNNEALQDISALSGLTEVQGLLEILDNPVLTAVPSFPDLAILGGLRVVGNTQLQEVGAAPLVGETGTLIISSNPSLPAIDDPFPALTSVSGALLLTLGEGLVEILGFEALETVGGSLQIGILPELTTLSSFPALQSVGSALALAALGQVQELEFAPSLESAGGIFVFDNGSLVELSGFGNVQSVAGNVSIFGHPVLSSLPALMGLESVGGRLELRGNEAMTSLDDFSSLGTVSGDVWIRDNPALQNLDGLSGVTSRIQALWIDNNQVLQSIAGLENLGLGTGRPEVPAVQGAFTVTNNPSLPESDAQDLAALLGVGGQITISGNLDEGPAPAMWVATGEHFEDLGALNASIWASIDGADWVEATVPAGADGLHIAASNGAEWIAVGHSGTLLASQDGYQWEVRNVPGEPELWGITWTGSQWVIVGEDAPGGNGVALTSSDGLTWTSVPTGTAGVLRAVAFNGSHYVAVGQSLVLISPDAESWEAVDELPGLLTEVGWSGTHWVAASADGLVFTSEDGIVWVQRELPQGSAPSLWQAAWDGGRWFLGGEGSLGGVFRSQDDGVTWELVSPGGAFGVTGVATSGGRTVRIDVEEGFAYTDDGGNTWTGVPIAGIDRLLFLSHRTGVSVNQAPSVTITEPADGAFLSSFEEHIFSGTAEDPEDGTITVEESYVWRSDLNGLLGVGSTISSQEDGFTLDFGTHIITLRVTDSGGAVGVARIEVQVGS